MSFEERNTFIAILTDLLVVGLFVWQITTAAPPVPLTGRTVLPPGPGWS